MKVVPLKPLLIAIFVIVIFCSYVLFCIVVLFIMIIIIIYLLL